MTRAEAENLQDGMQKMAATVWIFYDALIKAGFDDGHAMYLTGRMMDGLVGGIGKAAAEVSQERTRLNNGGVALPKVVCACTECKYNNEKHRCTAKEIAMSWHSVMTVWDGRQEYLKCKTFAMDDESLKLAEKIMKFMLAKRNE